MAINKKYTNNDIGENVENTKPSDTVEGTIDWCSHLKNSMEVSLKNKIKIELLYEPAILFLGIYQKTKQ